MVFMMEDFGIEPMKQRFFIGTTELADLRHLTDLCSMRFNRSPFPGILGKVSRVNTNLGREKAHYLGGHLHPRTGKTAFVLQTQGESPQICCQQQLTHQVEA